MPWGTHLLIADLRGRRTSRRWFAAVECEAPELVRPVVLSATELEIRFVRSRGPGGQNVNKRATAVQLSHRPTGIAVCCDVHRSQARNRAAALEALRDAVAEHLYEDDRLARQSQAWLSRRELFTRQPVMSWRVHPSDTGAIVPDDDGGD